MRTSKKDARVTFPGGGEAVIVVIRCDTCTRAFIPVRRTPAGNEVQRAFTVGAVDAIVTLHDGHALVYYAVRDDGDEVSGVLKVWAPRRARGTVLH